jgi:hypothetical protein
MTAREIAMTDRHRRQRAKNLVFLAVMVALVVLFYFITIVKMAGN